MREFIDKSFSPDCFDAVVFDLDGVVTRTAKVHAKAWKTMFDDYLASRTPSFKPFDIETDYRPYVDGKPRYEGVRSFLESRGIDIPYGDPEDSSDQETICGLGNRKNRLFREMLRTDGVEVYESSLAFIRAVRRAGMQTAVVSSSRNCRAVLEAAGIADLFDARVDGTDLERLGLSGKPAPDMFQEACRRLGTEPQRTVAIEDAEAGVQAGYAAGFGCVVGINRGDRSKALYDHGADVVVDDLAELQVASNASEEKIAVSSLPSALDCMEEILHDDRAPVFFLDYDGTLTPIVPHPDDAVLSDSMRATLKRLTERCQVAVISGRDLSDVRERVGIQSLWYAGSHGFDIAGPGDQRTSHQQGGEYLPSLDAAEKSLKKALESVPGCLVERKRFSIAIHYRQVGKDDVPSVMRLVEQIHAEHPDLRLSTGKKIRELQPDIDWNKGKALRWLMQTLNLDSKKFMPVYIGDDVTDEDAFREIEAEGVGILVAERDQSTRAAYRLDNPEAVERFLNRMSDKLERRK
ncbi:MAG: hypothetical protein Kow0060_20930 [Methylohalobius crimeensis]